MSGTRRSLRTRLLIAMAAIAVGVLVVTGVTTVALARRGARTVPRSVTWRTGAPGLVSSSAASLACIRGRDFNGRPTAPVGRLVTSVLRVTSGTVVTVSPDGTIDPGGRRARRLRRDDIDRTGEHEHDDAAGGPDPEATAPAVAEPAAAAAPFDHDTGPAAPVVPAANELPDGVTFEDLDAETLLAGERQTGYVNGRAFVALPVVTTSAGTAVLVLTEQVDSGAVSRASGFFLIGGALALAVAVIVSYFLARRLTRPLAAMGATAGAIAAGNLSARGRPRPADRRGTGRPRAHPQRHGAAARGSSPRRARVPALGVA